MLALNIDHILQLRGVTNSFSWLTHNGFSSNTAHRILNNKIYQVKMEHLEKLCMLLHCTPNDVLEWKADQNVALSQDHPLYSLIRRENAELHSFLKNASLEELGKLQEFISQIKKENGNTK